MNLIRRIVVSLCALVLAVAGEEPSSPGFRARLEQRGIVFGGVYVVEAAASPNGANLLGSLNANFAVDLHRLRLARGQIYFSAQDLRGRGTNNRLLDTYQTPSNLEVAAFRKVTEVWYADSWLDGKARVRIGRQYADRDFGAVASAGDFLNAAFGAVPTAPMPTYPDAALGMSAWIVPLRKISTGIGVFRGAFRVVESKFELSSSDNVALGTWSHSAVRGFYATGEHRFGHEPARPQAVFARFGGTPAATSSLTSYAGGGFVYGNAGIGITTVRPANGPREVVGEVFYKQRICSRMSLQPDVQWVAKRSGASSGRWVGGLRVTIEM
jgi:carbohydrate-selective porin OprB